MKYPVLFLFLLAILSGCADEPEKISEETSYKARDSSSTTQPQPAPTEWDEETDSTPTLFTEEVIAHFRANSFAEMDSAALDMEKLVPIKRTAFCNHTSKENFSFTDSTFCLNNYYDNWYYYDFTENDSFILVGIVESDESCCLTLYKLVFDKYKRRITDFGRIFYVGGDGEWHQDATLKRKGFGNYLIAFQDNDGYAIDDEDGTDKKHPYLVTEGTVSVRLNSAGKFLADTLSEKSYREDYEYE